MLGQDTWSDLVYLADQFEHGVVWKMLESKLALGDVSRIRLSEHGMAIARYDLPTLEG